MYLKGKVQVLEREVSINRTETNKSQTVAAEAKKALHIAKREAKELSGVVTELQRRLKKLEGLGLSGSDVPRSQLGLLDDSWGSGPGPGRPCAPGKANQGDHTPSARGSARPSDHMPSRCGSRGERDDVVI